MIILILTIVFCFLISFYLSYYGFKDWKTRAQFGSSFGAFSALFSGLAFGGIIYTIFLQRQELSLQREELEMQRQELELNRRELSRTADAQEKSEKALLGQMRLLNTSAKIDAYNSMINFYNAKADNMISNGKSGYVNLKKSEEYSEKIEVLLKEIERFK